MSFFVVLVKKKPSRLERKNGRYNSSGPVDINHTEVKYRIPPVDPSWSTTLHDTVLNGVVKYLCDHNSQLLTGIKGCGGVGKTVLGIQIAHNPIIKNRFSKVLYLRAGPDANERTLLVLLYQQVSKIKKVKLEGLSNDKLKLTILSIGLKRTLVIIDNVWNEEWLDEGNFALL